MLLSEGFLAEAKRRVEAKSELSEAALRRCMSDLYFALFHCVCEALASPLHDYSDMVVVREAWARIYRLPDHGVVSKQCDDGRIREFPVPIQKFASQLKGLKASREEADYDASIQLETSEVRNSIQIVETAIRGFKETDQQLQFAFAVFVSNRRRGL